MSKDVDRNDAMQKRNAQRMKKIFAAILTEWEADAQRAMDKYGSLPRYSKTATTEATYKYWKNVRSAMRWGRDRLRVMRSEKVAEILGSQDSTAR